MAVAERLTAVNMRPKASPATQMREMLARYRRVGVEFDRAWGIAWQHVRWPHDTEHRHEWKMRLAADVDEWREAYERRGQQRPALSAVYRLLSESSEELTRVA